MALPEAVLFDFDGVLVDSNRIKTEAFIRLFQQYDQEIIDQVVNYHHLHGGISREIKIQHAYTHLLRSPLSPQRLAEKAEAYADLVANKVIEAPMIPGAIETLERLYGKVPLFVVSGTPQDELNHIITTKNLQHYFLEILGSPIKKPEHIRDICHRHTLAAERSVFIGDAFTDLAAAIECNMKFIGIQGMVTFPEEVNVLPDCVDLSRNIYAIFPH